LPLGQIDIYGKDKVQVVIDRLRQFQPEEGYYLCFSGGKDSLVLYHLCKEGGIKFDAHYFRTSVDPPELIYFIRDQYKDVIVEKPKMTMWDLIIYKGFPPTRVRRYCCEYLKEGHGVGRVCLTGVRWSESVRRRNARKMVESCVKMSKFVVNPILDWSDSEVWEYLRSRGINYCELYDQGFTRLGCIGCPMSSVHQRVKEFKRWPKYYELYLRTFDKMLKRRIERNQPTNWENAQQVMEWWLYG